MVLRRKSTTPRLSNPVQIAIRTMKTLFPLSCAALFALGGCGSLPEVAVAPTPNSTPIETRVETSPIETSPPVTPAPTEAPVIINSNRSSLPPLPQIDNSPRPAFVPQPTPKVRPGQTIIISNARPTAAPIPRENPTIIVSNAPVAGRDLSASAAAARGLVWVNTASRDQVYHRPGGRFYGTTKEGYYTSEIQARARGLRAF